MRPERGSSVVGSVVLPSPDHGARMSDVRVSLRPTEATAVNPAGPPRGAELRKLTTAPDDSGFFQLSGVGNGAWMVTASCPGLADATEGPLTLDGGVEATLAAPLELAPLAEAAVVVDPSRDPDGEPWTLRLTALGSTGRREVVHDGPLPEDGSALEVAVAPGRYDLLVRDRRGDCWYWQEVEVAGGDRPVVLVEIPMVEVEGRVTSGGRPVEARLKLWSLKRRTLRRFDTGTEGTFQGVLPHAGDWSVQVYRKDGSSLTLAEPVHVEPPGPSGVSTVEITLPGGVVEGKVVDALGQPPREQARVTLRGDGNSRSDSGVRFNVTVLAGSDGEFELTGVPVGEYQIRAKTESALSTTETVSVVADGSEPWVSLILKPKEELEGVVVSEGGPIPGAKVTVWWPGLPIVETETGPDGRFAVGVSGELREMWVTVLPVGYAAILVRATRPSAGEPPLTLATTRNAGSLEVVWDADAALPGPAGLPGFDVPGGHGSWHTTMLIEWVAMTGGVLEPGHLRIGGMPQGPYRVCLQAHGDTPEAPPRLVCEEGVLAPGDTLRLELKVE